MAAFLYFFISLFFQLFFLVLRAINIRLHQSRLLCEPAFETLVVLLLLSLRNLCNRFFRKPFLSIARFTTAIFPLLGLVFITPAALMI